jgi:pimeloyl-ACP methyl ester carboxylesterase
MFVGCANGSPKTAFQPPRSSGTSASSATRQRWKERWRGTAPAARSAARLGQSVFRFFIIWGDADDTVGRVAAEGTHEFVSGAYQFEILPGVGHFAADQVPDRITELLLAHVGKHPV